jgi:hypothetical protein
MPKPEVLLLRVSLAPDIWRDVEISGSSSLYTHARVIKRRVSFRVRSLLRLFQQTRRRLSPLPGALRTVQYIGEDVPGSVGVKRTRVAAAFPEPGKKMLFSLRLWR